jgi:hypothetical protein
MELLKQYWGLGEKGETGKEEREESEPVIRDDTEPRVFPVATTDGATPVFRKKKRREHRSLPSINMSAFECIKHAEDNETAKEVCHAALRALSRTGTVIRVSVYEMEHEWRLVMCMGGTPILGTDQIDVIRSAAVGRIRTIMYSVHVPHYTDMQARYQRLRSVDSWEFQNLEEQPHALGVETSVSIYLIRTDLEKGEKNKFRSENASSEKRIRERKRQRGKGL